jgi:hypothetical protein
MYLSLWLIKLSKRSSYKTARIYCLSLLYDGTLDAGHLQCLDFFQWRIGNRKSKANFRVTRPYLVYRIKEKEWRIANKQIIMIQLHKEKEKSGHDILS